MTDKELRQKAIEKLRALVESGQPLPTHINVEDEGGRVWCLGVHVSRVSVREDPAVEELEVKEFSFRQMVQNTPLELITEETQPVFDKHTGAVIEKKDKS